MLIGPIIEFIAYPPNLVSAGHDGFCPYRMRPFDEIYVIASRWSNDPKEHNVEIWLPYNHIVSISNISSALDIVRVHRSGFLWHDRTREIRYGPNDRWLSAYGFTSEHPKHTTRPENSPLFAVLPGSPMQDNIGDLLISNLWRSIRDFHTRHRTWMQARQNGKTIYETAARYERDSDLVSRLTGC